jgi:hypothetical protein
MGLHEGALLVLKELDVADPDEVIGTSPLLWRRRNILEDPTPSVDRLEAGEDRRVLGLSVEQGPEAWMPSSAVTYARCTQKMSLKMALFVARMVSTSASRSLRRPRL